MIGIIFGIGAIIGLAGICMSEGVGVIQDGPPEPPEPEPRRLSLEQALREIREEKQS